jgi:hypothetical protein
LPSRLSSVEHHGATDRSVACHDSDGVATCTVCDQGPNLVGDSVDIGANTPTRVTLAMAVRYLWSACATGSEGQTTTGIICRICVSPTTSYELETRKTRIVMNNHA